MDSFAAEFDRLVGNVEKFIRGQDRVVRQALVCLFAEGHLLIEGVPGLAKTSLAKAIVDSIDGMVAGRIQFTPDLLPSDVTGGRIYRPSVEKFDFEFGPVFSNILLADEINRASPKTQSALLEVMSERQVTIDGKTREVPEPFVCIATQNPIEHQGTYPLPEAQIDRFMMMLRIDYPDIPDEVNVVADAVKRRRLAQAGTVQPVTDLDRVRRMIEQVREVTVTPTLSRYIVNITAATRPKDHPFIRLGVSPRGSVALAAAAQAHAASKDRDYAIPSDVKAVAIPVLRHRLLLTPEATAHQADQLLDEIMAGVPVPRDVMAGGG